MALIEETLFGTIDKVHDSIERLKAFEPKDRPYWLAFSGGKDSCVILELAKMAGVNFEAHYNVTSVDPPELVRFIREKYPEVSMDIPHDKNGKPITMWSLLRKKTCPPTRIQRYCCEKLKESSGRGTVTITGVRWAESSNRKNNQGMVTIAARNASKIKELQDVNFTSTARGGVVMNDDNAETRRAVEMCFRTNKTLVNPIIDWEDGDVWEFIHQRNIPYCHLYDEGYTRLGCIGCPMAGGDRQKLAFARYPKYKENYLRSFDAMWQNLIDKGLNGRGWKCGQDIFNWWVGDNDPTEVEDLTLFDDV